MYLLGYDIGSSSIKAALVDAGNGQQIAVVQSPNTEMEMSAAQQGWAEQHPDVWWKNICLATQQLLQQTKIQAKEIKAIGIAYQMHGLVVVDKEGKVLRPSIIWCDSRAASIGAEAFEDLGQETCLSHLLNSPGNFTASKLKWVKENEPELYAQIHKIMLPGDYIAMKLTGEIQTTISGLSEGILWDFKTKSPADLLMEHYQIDPALIPDLVPTFSVQGKLNAEAAKATGLVEGIAVNYRAGDQPNNAMSLNVLHPGEVAATGGTSGVVYGVVDQALYDQQSRVNGFAHVNYSLDTPNIGILLCINGSGIQYSWIKKQMVQQNLSYPEMEQLGATVAPGSDGLRILPFGNGAERIFNDRDIGAQVNNLQFNRHGSAHFIRAALEGIAFSFVYGMNILREMGLEANVIRVGNDNLFLSEIFSKTIASLTNCRIEMYETTGALGAAKAAGVAAGIYQDVEEAMGQLKLVKTYEPDADGEVYQQAYQEWKADLLKILTN